MHLIGDSGQMQLAILNPGSVVGEGAFFSRLPRSANVVATGVGPDLAPDGDPLCRNGEPAARTWPWKWRWDSAP